MPNITINTASTSFGLLPGDLSQFPGWLSQYLPATQTIYQDQSNVISDFLSIANGITGFIAANGVGSFNSISPTETQITEGQYSIDFLGILSVAFSEVTRVTMTNTATGETVTETGNLVFGGLPFQRPIQSGSTLTAITDSMPNSVSPSSTSLGSVPLNVSWNGSSWIGSATGWSETISDPSNNKSYQTLATEAPAQISITPDTVTTTGSSSLAIPIVTGVNFAVGDNSGATTLDSLAITGLSLSASGIAAPQVIAAAVAGNDTVSIAGTGSLNIAGVLVNASSTVTGMTLSDTAANVIANLDFLQTLAALGKLTSITLTDPGAPSLVVTPGQQSADAQALQAITSPHSIFVTTPTDPGLLGGLSANQQIELVYISYFNRSADGAGDTFWVGQNVQAQARGQGAGAAVSNIANSFTPQAETLAIYPFLGTTTNLNTPTGQAGLVQFVNAVYNNLFSHNADTPGQNFWVSQITNGLVGLGAAALAIANGSQANDAIEVKNKIAVATDFTTRTIGAGLGETAVPASFITTAANVLKGVDGVALNDASVTAGMAATTSFLASAAPSHQSAQSASVPPASTDSPQADPSVITVTASNQLIDPGVGDHTIQFLAGTTGDTLVLHAGGMDQVSGFNPGADVLDVRSLLSAASIDLNGDVAALGNYLTVADQGCDAAVTFDPTGHGGGDTVAVLQGLGHTVTGLDQLVAQGAIRIA